MKVFTPHIHKICRLQFSRLPFCRAFVAMNFHSESLDFVVDFCVNFICGFLGAFRPFKRKTENPQRNPTREFPESITSTGAKFWLRFCLSVLVLVISGKSQRVKTQRAKTSENFAEEKIFAEDISEDFSEDRRYHFCWIL